MAGKADYRTKYLDIRAKFIESVDLAFRKGFEQGMKEGQQAAQEQQMMMEQQAMAAAQGGIDPETGMPMEGAPPMEGEMPPEAMGGEEMPPEEMGEAEGSELDQHINELEGLVAKGEKPKVTDIRKAVERLTSLRKNQKMEFTKKTKTNSTAQKKFVDGILKKWEDEVKDTSNNLEELIENHVKKG